MFDFHQPSLDPDGEYDEDRSWRYVQNLMAAFNTSAEAQSLRDRSDWSQLMLEYGNDIVGVSPADMTRNDFEEILFEIFPRKVSTNADRAESIVTELRAFWTFVVRQYAAANAATMLAVLNDGAVDRLRTELANPDNYGMAKSMFMAGTQNGFDMTSHEGLAAFTAAYNASLQTGPKDLPATTRHPTVDSTKKKRKEKRKQRLAKKKNRAR